LLPSFFQAAQFCIRARAQAHSGRLEKNGFSASICIAPGLDRQGNFILIYAKVLKINNGEEGGTAGWEQQCLFDPACAVYVERIGSADIGQNEDVGFEGLFQTKF